jgi:prolipoprotein diacylglyceryl transferase
MFTANITWTADPEIFRIGGFALRWYGVLFALGFVLGYFIMQRFFKKEGVPVKLLDQLTTYMVVSTIIGARLGHCLFYEPEYYLSHPIEILKIWEGGLASHGATIAIIFALILFSRKSKLSFWWVIDRVALVTALAGCFIRLGNLMNSEIFGKVAEVPWAFKFVNAADPEQRGQWRHPTQIYEALSYFLIFLLLYYIYRKSDGKPREGMLISLFMILVFGVRFFIEFLKEPQVGFEQGMALNMGQLLSIPFVLLGIAGLALSYRSKKLPVR